MLRILLLSCLCVVLYASDPQTVLYVYESPYDADSTGFATLSTIDQGWKSYANGYPTAVTIDSEYSGIRVNTDKTDGVLFGEFQFWGNSYVGGILHFDPVSLEVFAVGKGISGTKVSDIVFLETQHNGTPQEYLVVLGSFWTFQQNPSSSTVNIGICTNHGENCYPLGAGLPDYQDNGKLLVLDEVIYALYLAVDKTCRIDMYNFNTGNFSGEWFNIYNESSYLGTCRQSMSVYTDDTGNQAMLLLGNQNDTAELNGMTLYKPSEGWSPYGPFPFTQKKLFVDHSFNNVIFLLQGTSFYRYDGQSWTLVWNGTACNSWSLCRFQVIDEWTLFSPCNDNLAIVQLSPNLPPDVTFYDNPVAYSCDTGYSQSVYDPASGTYWASCVGQTNVTFLDRYLINGAPVLLTHKDAGPISIFASDITSMCAFGNGKIFISGYFDRIGDYLVDGAAVWDGNYWRRLDPSLGLTKDYGRCSCASENQHKNSMIVVGCSVADSQWTSYSSFLLFADESVEEADLYDPPDTNSNSDIYPFSVVFQEQSDIIFVVALQSSIAYVAWQNHNNETSQITRWSWGFQETLVNLEGLVDGIVPYGDVIYASGTFGVDEQGNLKTLIRYNTTSQEYLPVDNAWDTTSRVSNFVEVFLQDSNDNSTIYVAGNFNEAGSLSYVRNVAVLNTSNAVFVDNLNGGTPGYCAWGTSIDTTLYLVYAAVGCSNIPQCMVLTSYNRSSHQWTYALRSGIYQLSQGYEYNPNLQKSSGLTWWMILIMGLGSIAASAALFCAGIVVFRIIKKRQMRKLHDRFSHIAYHPLVPEISVKGSLSSSLSIGEIDFQHEEMLLKSVLGRGSFGTVWSCVLPQRKGATYAVKQVLISAGETDKVAAVEKEIQILQQLRHKNIVHFAGYKKETSQSSVEFFLFMELFEKPCSLRGMIEKRLKKSSISGSAFFTFPEVKNFLEQILAGLQFLHHHGIAHRDLKCANILVRAYETTVTSLHIADFGLSKTFFDEAGSKVLASTVAGTPAFMAPEVLKGSKYDPFKADVWSFGIVIFEILSFLEPKDMGVRPKFPVTLQLPCLTDPAFKPILEMFEDCTETNPTARPDVDSLVVTLEDL